MQNTVYECKQNGEVFFSSLCVTYSCFSNYSTNGLVTEQPQYSVVVCIFSTLQNTEISLIPNGLRLIFTCLLPLALPCIFHIGRHGGIHVFRAQVRQFFVPFPQQVSRIPAAFFQARKGRVLFQFQEALHQCVAFFRVFRIDVRCLFPVGDGRITAGGHQERGQHR